jgi:hypothetical protein
VCLTSSEPDYLRRFPPTDIDVECAKQKIDMFGKKTLKVFV